MALRGAAGAPSTLAKHVVDPDIQAALNDGLEDLSRWTGMTDLVGGAWPQHLSRSLPDERDWARARDVCWFVKSPWPSVSVGQIIGLLWPEVKSPGANYQEMAGRIRGVLGWPQDRAVAAARLHESD